MPEQNVEWFPAKGEKNVVGRFGYEKIFDIPASKAADEKVYKDILVLYVRVAGDIDIPAPMKVLPHNQKACVNRFPEAWAAFEGNAPPVPGTPLSALGIGSQKLLELRIYQVTTVEQLAAISDQQCENMGFGTKTLRNQARELQAGTPKAEPAPAMPVGDFNTAVADAVAKALAAQQKPKNKGGRPRKVPPDAPAAEPAAA